VKRVERLADSGLSAREFAAEIGVNANTLAGWRWRMRSKRGAEPRKASPSGPTFLEIVAAPAAGVENAQPAEQQQRVSRVMHAEPTEALELVLRSGHRIRVPVRFDPAALRRLVDALEVR